MILQEIHHGVKNNLQLILSILNLQVRASAEPGVRRSLKDTQRYVQALSVANLHLYQTDVPMPVAAAPMLHDILNRIMDQDPPYRAHITIRVDDTGVITVTGDKK